MVGRDRQPAVRRGRFVEDRARRAAGRRPPVRPTPPDSVTRLPARIAGRWAAARMLGGPLQRLAQAGARGGRGRGAGPDRAGRTNPSARPAARPGRPARWAASGRFARRGGPRPARPPRAAPRRPTSSRAAPPRPDPPTSTGSSIRSRRSCWPAVNSSGVPAQWALYSMPIALPKPQAICTLATPSRPEAIA